MIDEKKLTRYIKTEINPYGKPFDGTVFEFGNMLMDYIERMEKEPERKWIPVSERLPKNEQEVEVTYVQYHWKTCEPLYFTCRAFYTDGTMTTEDSDYVWDDTDNFEYNESLDAYIIPEGWWEAVRFAEEFYCIDRPVIAWRPLPEPYKAGDE